MTTPWSEIHMFSFVVYISDQFAVHVSGLHISTSQTQVSTTYTRGKYHSYPFVSSAALYSRWIKFIGYYCEL